MSVYAKPTQVFAALTSAPKSQAQPKEVDKSYGSITKEKSQLQNEIQVSARGEISMAPDRGVVVISVGSVKDQAQEVKNSVTRRLDYIIQTLNNHNVKENEMRVSKTLQRMDGLYHMRADVTVEFTDFIRCQSLSNLLVEKLDESVKVSSPEFFHSRNKLDNLRRQAGVLAVTNAKNKATEMAGLLNAKVGQVLGIVEENSSEWEGSSPSGGDMGGYHQKIAEATLNVAVQISVKFQLLVSKAKNKSN